MYNQPHPLFDPDYYLERYPDVAQSGQDPLTHFLYHGGFEGRQPHPDFDTAFYLESNPDVVASGLNPLVHFLQYGAAEGRLPHPDFDRAFYLAAYPDVVVGGMDPLVHFVEFGAAEGRSIRPVPPNLSVEAFLPVCAQVPRAAAGRDVDVIIPVYKGVAETKACIASVLASRCAIAFRVVVVNDCSPEPELTDHLQTLAREGKVVLIENSRNLGFVASVNAGMQSSDRDVVLLNSDTLVFNDWLDRLSGCAYADEQTGTVTPFSNNATVCSYPVVCSDNQLPDFVDLAALDSTFASVNCGRSVGLPTAVGFCMFIRRRCLQAVGLFDADAFGAGYGEENDFCMRSAAKGWSHKLACDVFVYHAGGVSFGEAAARQQAAMRVLVGKHPRYPVVVQRHILEDPANAYRMAVTAQRIRNSGKRVFLSVVHALGGGAGQHASQLIHLTANEVIWLTLRPFRPDRVILECEQQGYQFSLRLNPVAEHEHLTTVLSACGVERIHIHHTLGHAVDLQRLVDDLGVPFDFTAHDYYTICPQVTLSDEHGRYCGEPGQAGCDQCLAKRPSGSNGLDIVSWRAQLSWLPTRANRVIAPSADVAARMRRYYPAARLIAAEHPGPGWSRIVIPKRRPSNDPLRIVAIGTMTTHKGFRLLQGCAEDAARHQLPLQFTLVGSTEAALKSEPLAFSETGSYGSTELAAILESVAPDLVWFPGQCAETFSYTLSACLELGLPVAVHDIGAFPERVGGRPWTWVVPREWSAEEWIAFFKRVRQDHFITGTPPPPPPSRPRGLADFYPGQYLADSALPAASRSVLQVPVEKRVMIAAALETDQRGQIQGSGYVRVVLPLTHPAVADSLRLLPMTPKSLLTAEADVILVQRTAIRDMDTAERIVDRCRTRGSQLVFEIDDDLLHIPTEHPEYEHYTACTRAARRLAESAHTVIVSTDILRQQMLEFNANTIVVPNYLDDRLWMGPVAIPEFGDVVRILYYGTVSHRDDVEFLGDAVRQLGAMRSRVQVEIISIGIRSPADGWFQAIPVPNGIEASYPRFVEWIRNQNRWHWAVAPLLDSQFNRSKSALKILEYAALGLPSICSEGPVYSGAVRHEETALLVTNDLESWRHALERAATDAALWMRLRERSQVLARENTISARAEIIKSAWRNVIRGGAENVAAAKGRLVDRRQHSYS